MNFRGRLDFCGGKVRRRFTERFFGIYSPDVLAAYWRGNLGQQAAEEIYEALQRSPELQEQLSRVVEQLRSEATERKSTSTSAFGSGQSD